MNLTDVKNRSIEAALPFLQELCDRNDNSLDPRELKLLECALRNHTVEKCYTENQSCFSNSIHYTKTTISPNLWHKISLVIHKEMQQFTPNFPRNRINRASIWSSLGYLVEAKERKINRPITEPKLHQVPLLETCYGRTSEVDQLATYILQDNKRGIFIIGLAGIGKATLVNQFIHERVLSSNKFSHIFWCPVRHTSIAELIQGILRNFHPIEHRESVTRGTNILTAAQFEANLINQLVEVLHQHSILLVFPDWCSLFSDQESGSYLPEYQPYKQLLDIVLRRRHRSCVLILSSQLPDLDHRIQPKYTSSVVSMVVRGLDKAAAQELLISHLPNFDYSQSNITALTELVQQYGGHPWALIRLADIITHSFHNNIHGLLVQQTIILDHPLEQLLASQFQRWEALEKKLLFHLALACRPLTQAELYDLFCRQTPNSTLLNRLHKLFGRGIIYISNPEEDSKIQRYFIEPIVQKYLQNQFIGTCSQEILELAEDPQTQRLIYLNDYYLAEPPLRATVVPPLSVDIVSHHQRLILERIFFQLSAAWKTIEVLQQKLGQIMDLVASRSWVMSGYAQHNLTALLSLSNDPNFLAELHSRSVVRDDTDDSDDDEADDPRDCSD